MINLSLVKKITILSPFLILLGCSGKTVLDQNVYSVGCTETRHHLSEKRVCYTPVIYFSDKSKVLLDLPTASYGLIEGDTLYLTKETIENTTHQMSIQYKIAFATRVEGNIFKPLHKTKFYVISTPFKRRSFLNMSGTDAYKLKLTFKNKDFTMIDEVEASGKVNIYKDFRYGSNRKTVMKYGGKTYDL